MCHKGILVYNIPMIIIENLFRQLKTSRYEFYARPIGVFFRNLLDAWGIQRCQPAFFVYEFVASLPCSISYVAGYMLPLRIRLSRKRRADLQGHVTLL